MLLLEKTDIGKRRRPQREQVSGTQRKKQKKY